jgi:hypothetical protein
LPPGKFYALLAKATAQKFGKSPFRSMAIEPPCRCIEEANLDAPENEERAF